MNNGLKGRYEIHYSPLWRGPTNVLSCETRLFGDDPTCNYFIGIDLDVMKEMNNRIPITDMTEGKDFPIKTSLSSNIKRVFTCEVIQHSNGKHYIRVLATDKEYHRWEPSTWFFDNLQVQWTLLLLISRCWTLTESVWNESLSKEAVLNSDFDIQSVSFVYCNQIRSKPWNLWLLTFSCGITIHKLIAQFAQNTFLSKTIVGFTLVFHSQVFVFHWSDSFNDPKSIASFHQKNIVGVNAGINFNLLWVTHWETFQTSSGQRHFDVYNGVSEKVTQS